MSTPAWLARWQQQPDEDLEYEVTETLTYNDEAPWPDVSVEDQTPAPLREDHEEWTDDA